MLGHASVEVLFGLANGRDLGGSLCMGLLGQHCSVCVVLWCFVLRMGSDDSWLVSE